MVQAVQESPANVQPHRAFLWRKKSSGSSSADVEANMVETLSQDGRGCVIHETNNPTGKNDDPPHHHHRRHRSRVVDVLIVLVGAAAAGIILGFGISSAKNDENLRFDRVAQDILTQFQMGIDDYVRTGLWVHQTTLRRDTTHAEFRLLYEYIVSSGLEVQSVALARNITHAERPAAENITKAYLAEAFPDMPYFGFVGFQFSEQFVEPQAGPRSEQPFYYPVRFIEPTEDPLVRGSIDLDLFSLPPHRAALEAALSTWEPSLTERLQLAPEILGEQVNFVILMHPGAQAPGLALEETRDVSTFAIQIREMLRRAYLSITSKERVSLHVYDSTDSEENPTFLGAAVFHSREEVADLGKEITLLPEAPLSSLTPPHSGYEQRATVKVCSRQWTFVVLSDESSFQPDFTFVILASVLIFVACIGLAIFIRINMRRAAKLDEIQMENAKMVAQREREMNDFVAHEVRNPLAAAISALSFVSSAVNEADPLHDEESRKSVREDVHIIDRSLQFINDLLRSMLDMHRASSNQLKIEFAQTDLLRDVLEPSSSLLYRRGDEIRMIVDCPENLVVMTDRLRLKQIILNLGRNSMKFVTKGFIRFRSEIVGGKVVVSVEDSGPGIPESKRHRLFAKFQESLDSLSQGTGIGLSVCKSLSGLMGCDLKLDETYDSGIEGCPGARFVLSLNVEPILFEPGNTLEEGTLQPTTLPSETEQQEEDLLTAQLPKGLEVLFVDDDTILRRLFSRSVKKICPSWNVSEAANGETAIRLVESKNFDVIFMDQYMAGAEKQLLGTETARALRAKGVESIICGLSANDMEKPFCSSGADCFVIKPLPCERRALSEELIRIVGSRSDKSRNESEVKGTCD